MSELLPPPLNQPPGLEKNTDMSSGAAEVYMQQLGHELESESYMAAWGVVAKNGNTVSEDVAYLHADQCGQTFIGVFDGVGGHNAGDMAARAAQDVLHRQAQKNTKLSNPLGFFNDFFPDAVDEIENRVNASDGELAGAGTTGLVGILVEGDDGSKKLYGAAVGDSLGFIVRRDGTIKALNREETQRQEFLDKGYSEQDADPYGNVITNAVKPGTFTGVHQFFEEPISEGDVIVFTSDGITGDRAGQRLAGGLSNEDVITGVALDTTLSPHEKAQRLIELSTKKDDKTALILEVKSPVHKFTLEDLRGDMAELREWMKNKDAEDTLRYMGKTALDSLVAQEIETSLDTRQKEIFDIVPQVNAAQSSIDDYAKLLVHGSDEELSKLTVEGAAVRSKEGRVVTEDSLAYTTAVYKNPHLDSTVRALIQEKVGSLDVATIAEHVRTDKELRYTLAEQLLQKVDAMQADMPERVRKNGQKKPSGIKGYEHLQEVYSREWVALLALSKLDGTFQPDKVTVETQYDSNGEVVLNQHTTASDMVLFQ